MAIGGALLLVAMGWSVLQATRVDMLAEQDPEAALRLSARHPRALLATGQRALRQDRYADAEVLARQLLVAAPGQGQAFGVLALAAAGQRAPGATTLLAIAARRSGRDREVRATAAAVAFQSGDLRRGMTQLDALLRIGPRNAGTIYAAMAQQAADPAFAEVLVDALSAHPAPRWRRNFLGALGGKAGPRAVDQVYAGLQSRGELSEADARRWLDRLMRDGRWGEATLEVCLAIAQSARERKEIRLSRQVASPTV